MQLPSAIRSFAMGTALAAGIAALAHCSSGGNGASSGDDASAPSASSSSSSSSGGGSTAGSSSSGASGSGAGSSSSSGGGSSGSSSSSGSGSDSGAASSGGAADGGGTTSPVDAGSCTLPTAPQTCAHAALHKSAIVDFTTYQADGTWGDSTTGDLTGGTSYFQAAGTTQMTLAVQGSAPDTALHVTGTIPGGAYAGFVLWFGPCVNATAVVDSGAMNSAMNFAIGGSLGGASLKFQVQTHDDYPVDVTNAKGACLYQTCDSKYSDCVSPTDTLTTLPATPTFTTFPWTDFVGGKPVAGTTGDGLVGLQFQYECPGTTSCAVDMTLGAIVLM